MDVKRVGNLHSFIYYSPRLILIFYSALIRPSRYIAFAGLMLAIFGLGLLKGACLSDFSIEIPSFDIGRLDFDGKKLSLKGSCLDPESAELWVSITYVIFSVFLSGYLSFYFVRRNTEDFTKLLSNYVSTDKLIRFLAYETRKVARSINSIKNSQGRYLSRKNSSGLIRTKINNNRAALRTIENLKGVLAKRLMISPSELSDDFLRFNSTVYINRQIHRAELLDDHIYRLKYDPVYPHAKGPFLLNKADDVKEQLSEVEDHLLAMTYTNMDYSRIEQMFQTRSIAVITRQFITNLDAKRKSLVKGSYNNFELFAYMLNSHRTGAAVYRSIGVAILLYINKLNTHIDKFNKDPSDKKEDKLEKFQNELKEELLIRAKAASGQRPTKQEIDELKCWSIEAKKLKHHQKEILVDKVVEKLKQKITEVPPDGKLFIVIASYSRLVGYIARNITNIDVDKLRIVILVDDDKRNDYATRLMFHHITIEQNEENQILALKTWRSKSDALMSHIDHENDRIVILSSADRIGHENTDLEKDRMVLEDGKYHCHQNIAYLHFPMEKLNELCPNNDAEFEKDDQLTKDEKPKIDVIVVGGSYKYDLKILIDQFLNTTPEIADKLRSTPRKRRRAGLYEWKSNDNFKVEVVSVPLESFSIQSNSSCEEENSSIKN